MIRVKIPGYNCKLNYANTITQLRLVQLISLFIQAVIMYLELHHIGMSGFLLPFSAILVSFYVHCQRWYKMVDGRSDVRRMIQVKNIRYKLQYAFAIFSGLLLALFVHIVAPARLSGLNSLGFMLADYSNIVSSGIVLVSDLVKGIFGKELKST